MLHGVVLMTLVGLSVADFDPKMHAKYLTMPKSSFIEFFNAQNYTWKIREYDNIEEKFTSCARFDQASIENLPLLSHNVEAIDLPDKFDAREQWPQCETIKEIYNQGDCNSCWTFGTATTASDRTCIHKDIHVRLSEQDLECSQTNVCGGGWPHKAFSYWQSDGLVTQECKPYNIPELYENKCTIECVNTAMNYIENKHYAEKVYRLSNNSDEIKAELVKNGPLQAGFAVFEDFKEYKSGIYVHTFGETVIGRHSVRIIGYGVEDGVEYWLVANSWGSIWGENGWFKVKTNQKGLEFENYLITGLPKN